MRVSFSLTRVGLLPYKLPRGRVWSLMAGQLQTSEHVNSVLVFIRIQALWQLRRPSGLEKVVQPNFYYASILKLRFV